MCDAWPRLRQIPFQVRMSHLIGSTSGLDSAIAMRARVDALELAAVAVTHWHEILELYEEARIRAVEEQKIDVVPPVRRFR